MRVVVTGSSGHLGEALMRVLPQRGHEAVGLDRLPGPFTQRVGSITDRAFVDACLAGAEGLLHTATLHKPHVATHSRQQFVETNISGTLHLLESAAAQGLGRVVFTSTTSAFGASLRPPPGGPAVWVDEALPAVPKNIYGSSKTAAEDLCHLIHRLEGLPVLVLRTARFFPEEDDDPARRARWSDENLKANEFLHRRADLEDIVEAHLLALEAAPRIGFRRFILSATTPFERGDCAALATDAVAVLARRSPRAAAVYAARGYRGFATLDRVYDNRRAREELGWRPRWDFARILDQLERGAPLGSDLARAVGAKGYHRP